MGTIYKRKSSDSYWVRYYRDGKCYRESSKSDLKSVAKELLIKRERELQKGGIPGIHFDRVKFEDIKEMFLRDRRINGRSVADAKKRVRNLEPFFGGAKVPTIKSDRIAGYIDKRLAGGAANATINRELAALRRMLRLGYRAEKVARVPYIKMLAENNTKEGFLEPFEYEALLEALPAYLKGFLSFGYLTGWRKEEAAGLTWGRVNLQRRTVSLESRQTKNKKARHMYMEEELLSVMLDQWAAKADGCDNVFQRDGEQIKDFRGAWNAACREAGIGYGYKDSRSYVEKWEAKGLPEGPTYHDLRRTAVREMDQAGISRKVAMLRTGHKTESTYNRYNIGTDSDLKEAARKLDRHRSGQEAEPKAEAPVPALFLLASLLASKAQKSTENSTVREPKGKRT
jgi:integrase